ncbi:helix-turn-helix domain-containing protein [Novosphingobium beihaiensis]|uniref:Helix-turn-helix domain-containing protein n=1 Tax=Novosphingobium beihaiensis TaxID=2930389 RepID=A0ABT0BK71_9SPHN|nr:helix-turn-helix transcriptional regulator [Novosphingobium beihaiensis]MCJ2185221.1 helix-turn-helix domain-containing protein [Novosphingobium beihaiensis]
MVDLRTRFGRLVKAHRVRLGITQEALAERAGISTDMVSKIESGNSGARFGVIVQLADALEVDPAELFTPHLPAGQLQRLPLTEITSRLASLSDSELRWLKGIIDAALQSKAL